MFVRIVVEYNLFVFYGRLKNIKRVIKVMTIVTAFLTNSIGHQKRQLVFVPLCVFVGKFVSNFTNG